MNTVFLVLLALQSAGQQASPGDGGALSRLAAFYLDTDRPAEAETAARRVLALERGRRGPRSAEVAYALNLWGSALSRLGRHREAVRALRESVAICTATLGGHHLETARARANLAAAMIAAGKWSSAEALLRTSETTLRAEVGEGHMEVAVVRHNLGTVYLAQKRLAMAEAELTAALRTWEGLFGARSPNYLRTANLLIRTQRAAGETTAAARLAARILPLAEQVFGASHVETARARLSQAEIDLERGDAVSAERWARGAIEAQKDSLPANRAEFLNGLSFYRTVLQRLGEKTGAQRVQRWARYIRNTNAAAASAYVRQPCGSSL